MKDTRPPDLQKEIAETIRQIRRGMHPAELFPVLDQMVREYPEEICAACNIRWLISICDTYADHAPPDEAKAALSISVMLYMLRMAETVAFLCPEFSDQRVDMAKRRRFILYDGVQTVHLDRQDTFLKLSKRLHRGVEAYPHLGAILDTILERLHCEDTILAVLRSLSDQPERYLPVDPRQPDNYGQV